MVFESKSRSLTKTVTWRVTGSGATFLIAFLISGTWQLAGTIAVIQLVANTALYYVHERLWARIKWGKQ